SDSLARAGPLDWKDPRLGVHFVPFLLRFAVPRAQSVPRTSPWSRAALALPQPASGLFRHTEPKPGLTVPAIPSFPRNFPALPSPVLDPSPARPSFSFPLPNESLLSHIAHTVP